VSLRGVRPGASGVGPGRRRSPPKTRLPCKPDSPANQPRKPALPRTAPGGRPRRPGPEGPPPTARRRKQPASRSGDRPCQPPLALHRALRRAFRRPLPAPSPAPSPTPPPAGREKGDRRGDGQAAAAKAIVQAIIQARAQARPGQPSPAQPRPGQARPGQNPSQGGPRRSLAADLRPRLVEHFLPQFSALAAVFRPLVLVNKYVLPILLVDLTSYIDFFSRLI
jgi:hypothetical protein